MSKKHRETWLYGLNPVLEALRAGKKITAVYLYSGRHEKTGEIKREAAERDIPLKITGLSFFDERFPKGHQGIAAKVPEISYAPFEEVLAIPEKRNETPFFVILDGIEDPRNLGAILRSAEAAGVHGVIIQKHRAAGLTPEVYKASAGAVEYMPVSMVANIKNAMAEMKKLGISIAGAEAGGESALWDIDMSGPLAVVLGSEGQGLRKTVKDKCDAMISLPMRGRINSINVSVAGGIIFFEVLRQRFKNHKLL